MLLAGEDTGDVHHQYARRLLEGADPVATLDLAYYEVTNVAIRAWSDRSAAERRRGVVAAIESDGGLVHADAALLAAAAELATTHGLSDDDAAYAAGAYMTGAPLVSCDVRDLVSGGFARSPEATG